MRGRVFALLHKGSLTSHRRNENYDEGCADEWSEWYQFVDANPELSQREMGEHFGLTPAAVSRRWAARKLAPFTYGEPESATDDPELPDIARQCNVDELKTHVSVIEAFLATLHQQLTYLPDAPNGAPTHQRGFVMADDLCEAIHAYATAHHRQVKDVLDLALHRFFAQVGQEVGRA
jgi:hypothetical protein